MVIIIDLDVSDDTKFHMNQLVLNAHVDRIQYTYNNNRLYLCTYSNSKRSARQRCARVQRIARVRYTHTRSGAHVLLFALFCGDPKSNSIALHMKRSIEDECESNGVAGSSVYYIDVYYMCIA